MTPKRFACEVVMCGMLAPLSVFAQNVVHQDVRITIAPDFSAHGVWAIPVDAKNGSTFGFSDFQGFGSTGAMSYRVTSIANEEGPLQLNSYGGQTTVNNIYTKRDSNGAVDTSSLRNLFVTYDMKTAVQRPLAVYEFWLAGGGDFHSPLFSINIPTNWKLVSSWPEGTLKGQTLSIPYPPDSAYAAPVIVVLAPPDAGAGNQVATVGRFTIAGSAKDVARLSLIVGKMSYLETLFTSRLGVAPPASIVLYAADLRDMAVGYEAAALAAHPNLILYNTAMLATESDAEIASTIVHETAHLVEMAQKLFRGSEYIAPWFREGLAVFVENEARSYVYADAPAALTLADLTRRTHRFSPSELARANARGFDFLFDGSIPHQTITESYTRSGAVMSEFFNAVGAKGISALFDALKNVGSSQVVFTRDSDVIVNAMISIAKRSRDDILAPGKAASQSGDIAKLTHPEFTPFDDDALVDYIQHKVPSYVEGGAASAVIASPASAPTPVAIATSSCAVFARTLKRGSSGEDVKKLQAFLARQGVFSFSATGLYGVATEKAVGAWQLQRGILKVKTAPGYGTVSGATLVALNGACVK